METHNEQYEKLQEEYLKNRDNKTLGQMYSIAKEAAYNYLKKYRQQHGLYNLDIKEKSHEAALFIIEQYLKKPEFHVDKLSAYIYFGCLKSLFKNIKTEQMELSYEELMERKEHKNKNFKGFNFV
jgi:hypothetical protein